MTLQEKQNQEIYRSLLAAQRNLYSKAKRLRTIKYLLALLSVLSTFIIFFLPDTEDYWILIIGVGVTAINEAWLSQQQQSIIQKAARIQEAFDVNLYNIEWNEGLAGSELNIHSEEVKDNYNKEKLEKQKELFNWYPFDTTAKEDIAILLAQRSNLAWDRRQRKIYYRWLLGLFLILLLGPLLFAAFYQLIASDVTSVSTFDYLVKFLAPTLPLLIIWYKSLQGQHVIMQEQEIKEQEIALVIKAALASGQEVSKDKLRHFQDGIYKNRSTGEPVPDFIYNSIRSNFDARMFETAKGLATQ